MKDNIIFDISGSEMPKASASPSESKSSNDEMEQKRQIVELSNSSILHGYDLAINLLVTQGMKDAVDLLATNRAIIEISLKNGITERL